MLNTKPDSVQRTLIVTIGTLAQGAGDEFTQLLAARRGPGAAIATVACATTQTDTDFLTAVTAALTTISPPDLAAQLAATGWVLSAVDELALILLMDAVPDGGSLAGNRFQTVTAAVHRHLGIEATSLLIWLVGEEGETAVSDCLLPHIPVTRGMIPIGLRNEAGLRLPDSAALSPIGAELLWVLTATPLRSLPEWVVAQPGHTYTGQAPMMSVGVAGWEWSPATTNAAFMHRWLEAVFAHWLAQADTGETDVEIASWMQENRFSQDAFAAPVIAALEKQLPIHLPISWQTPWPWQLRPLLTECLFQAEADMEGCTNWQEGTCLQWDDTEVQQATAILRQHIKSMLDQHPVAGVSRAVIWLEQLIEACDEQIGRLLDQADMQAETSSMLATERGDLQKQVEGWLTIWPTTSWRAWIKTGLQPWKWLRLGWHYWQIQQLGQQLTHLLAQQAAQRRQLIVNVAVRYMWAALQKNTRRLQSQVEEIGDMLHHVAAELTTGSIRSDDENQTEIINHQSSIVNLPIPHIVYQQLIQDEEAEATATAAAIGGFGRQVTALDDAQLMGLPRLAADRLAQAWQLTAVDAFVAAADGDKERLHQWWQQGVDAACPLWRPDETRLHETERMQNGRLTLLCGADGTLSPVSIMDEMLSQQAEPISTVPSYDRSRLLLLRIRSGLTAAAMTGGE